MSIIKETTLHPDGNEGVDLYPKTNINQVQELPQKLTSVENQINQLNIDKLTKPTNPSAESVVTMLADGTVGTKLLSEIGGGGKLYQHLVQIKYNSSLTSLFAIFYTSNLTPINTLAKIARISPFINCVYNGNGRGSVIIEPYAVMGSMDLCGVIISQGNAVNVYETGVTPTEITDDVTEV